jgi:hypothetical protein
MRAYNIKKLKLRELCDLDDTEIFDDEDELSD